MASFLMGMAKGAVDAGIGFQEENRKQRDKDRTAMFENYRTNLIPRWEKENDEANQLVTLRNQWVSYTGSEKFGDFIVSNRLKDPKDIAAAYQQFNFTPAEPMKTPVEQSAAPTTDATNAALRPGYQQDMAGAKQAIQTATPSTDFTPRAPAAPEVQQGVQQIKGAEMQGQAPASPATPQAPQQASKEPGTPVPDQRSFADILFGKADQGKLREEVVSKLATEYGVSPAEMNKRLSERPLDRIMPTKSADGTMQIKQAIDPVGQAMYETVLKNVDLYSKSDQPKVMEALSNFSKHRNVQQFIKDVGTVPFLSKEGQIQLQGEIQERIASIRTSSDTKTIELIREKIAKGVKLTPGEEQLYEDSKRAVSWQQQLMSGALNGTGGTPDSTPPAPSNSAPQAPAKAKPPLTPPKGVPSGAQYSPSRKMWRDPQGKLYYQDGTAVGDDPMVGG